MLILVIIIYRRRLGVVFNLVGLALGLACWACNIKPDLLLRLVVPWTETGLEGGMIMVQLEVLLGNSQILDQHASNVLL